jgi:NAD+ synthase (glutamine-hydrolysing)
MKIALGQINATVGDLKGNAVKIKSYIEKAKKERADIIAFPELSITGYPPQDLLLNSEFIIQNKEMLSDLVEATEGILAIIGFVDYDASQNLFNAAAVIKDKQLISIVHKTLLPTYDVFDEDRYFQSNEEAAIQPILIEHNGFSFNLGVEICEDLWDQEYKIKVTDLLAERGSNLIINISASPFYAGKVLVRLNLLKEKALKTKIPLFYVNLVGGQDELVFDGQSFAVDSRGYLMALAKQFEEDLIYINLEIDRGTAKLVPFPPYEPEEEIFNALVLGIRDYFRKTGFEGGVVGMSGGIDSSLTTCLAVEALGKDHVLGVSMPSRFSSDHSKSDAQILAENLGIYFIQIPIQKIVDIFTIETKAPLEKIRHFFKINKSDDDPIADENIQPRVRGNILMDISNRLKKLRILVLNTGNKTELALGYCTLYGDMSGGIGALGDVSKLEVYKLAHYYNNKRGQEMIPENVFTKKPSPELKENQFDPFDFDTISPLVDEIIENRRSKQELIDMGYLKEIVEDTIRRIKLSEYKRWQATPCIKITKKAFGIGWKMPIVNKYDDAS